MASNEFDGATIDPRHGKKPSSILAMSVDACATRANLKRRLAVSILSKKLQDTLEKQKHEGVVEYNPAAPAYEHDIHADYLAYDPFHPQY